MADRVNGFLGDTPLRVFIKLVLISIVVGVIMRSFGWMPWDVLRLIKSFFERIWNMGFKAVAEFGDYLLLGAAVVVPAFILLRILALRKR